MNKIIPIALLLLAGCAGEQQQNDPAQGRTCSPSRNAVVGEDERRYTRKDLDQLSDMKVMEHQLQQMERGKK